MKSRAEQWFQNLRDLWLVKDIAGVRNLLSESFLYFENPLKDPLTTWAAVEEAWQEVKDQDISKLEIISFVCNDQEGTARYEFVFTDASGVSHESSGAYFVALDQSGRATEFRQWWVSK